MNDVFGNYIDTIVAENEKVLAEKENVIADTNTKVVTYLVEQNKTNEEIKKILPTVDDNFINSIRNGD